MQKWFVLALQGSLVIGLTALVGQAVLLKVNFSHQRRYLFTALVLAVLLAFVTFSFWLTTLAAKQSFNAQTSLAVTGASLILLLFLWLPVKNWPGVSRFVGWLSLLAVLVLTYVFTIDIIPYFQNVFTNNTAFITTAMIVRLSLGFIAILLSLTLTAALSSTYFSSSFSQPLSFLQKGDKLETSEGLKMAPPLLSFKVASSLGLLAVCLTALTTFLQMLLVLGKLPATPFIFNFVAVLVNQADKWFYLIFASLALAAFLALTYKPPMVKVKNKAQARKVKAAQRRQRRWAASATIVAALIISFTFINQTMASRTVQLSAPKKVQAKNGFVLLNLSKIKDKNLHRFVYNANGSKVRFLVIYKGANLFGTAFDACELCGQAGYYQSGNDIICRNCNSVINKATVGFPGGCNPIPLASKIKNGKLFIKVKDIEAKAGVFK